MRKEIEETLQRKINQQELVTAWFDYEFVNCKSESVIMEYEKIEIEITAQIKILRFLLSNK